MNRIRNMYNCENFSFFRLFITVIAAGAVACLGIFFLLPGDIRHLTIKENGFLENSQVVLYIMGALISFVYFRQKIWERGAGGAIILVFCALRELDFQTKFTAVSITRTKFYFSPIIPVFTKILGGAVVLFMIMTIVIFIRQNAGDFLRALKRQERSAHYVLLAIILFPIAVLTDASLRYLKHFKIATGETVRLLKTVSEELLELAIPLLLVLALLKYGTAVPHKKSEQE